ncbi:MAG: hypothetical protein PUP93_10600 [Rhizonema sp. NSF051]|nr:hypothetical protein [Rhizonema sp. NSF051]
MIIVTDRKPRTKTTHSFPDALVKVDDNVVAAITNHPNDRHQVLLLLLHEQKLS